MTWDDVNIVLRIAFNAVSIIGINFSSIQIMSFPLLY